ncbi:MULTISPECIES: ABC transporter permease [unclassified Actinomyces]|uniref:ABC transporter permease n=1 Tax=unclassified Actinomyces TaxID=2609248 RepID=UPI0020172AED|nr:MULTISPECIES: ABC transporter permease [unclassified Actinomyces]MCL3777696.1 ABC transporter permease [Actinomyces sp. AC-20-1]MCL3790157.1 ABC transporter permease [Actinomyces sp. 187325]MCL3792502.1 ABC transporter permease [Actinomyces sp. 186855]MCL3793851.1 ABC transporter permease [Actinomyces sp. 217892]
MSESTTPAAGRDESQPGLARQIAESNGLMGLLAVVSALIVGSVLILIADADVRMTAGYLMARPSDFLGACATSLGEAYSALLRGGLFDWQASSTARMWRPLTETLVNATPLIFAGLGMAVAFRAGLFNVGGQGQLILGAVVGGYAGFAWDLPAGLHLVVAILGAIVGGALWGAVPGVLKATTGASEVITTIMLNSIGAYLIAHMLTLKTFIGEGNSNPRSLPVGSGATYPLLLGPSFRLHAGFILALLTAWFVWWLLERSTLGFQFRATGLNPEAARTAGVNVPRVTALVMIVSGALCGLAATGPVLGTQKYLTASIAGSIGFDAMTVALLGRSKPLGTVLAGILFGGLTAGGTLMQAATGTPIDIVLILQSTIVLFIAAPPLVRAIYRLPAPGSFKRAQESKRLEAETAAAATAAPGQEA